MRKFVRLFIIPIFLYLSSCANSSSVDRLPHITYSYEDVREYIVTWENIFSINLNNYNVYVYSTHCSHCVNIKDKIIAYTLENKNTYFVECSKKIKMSSNVEQSIGATDIENVYIKGTPSLINITNHRVSANYAGQYDISIYLGI